MAEAPTYVGILRKGDTLRIPVSNLTGGWEPNYFDVIDCATRSKISSDNGLTYSATGGPGFVRYVEYLIDETNFREGEWYGVLVKENTGEPPTDGEALLFHFRVEASIKQPFLGFCEEGRTFYFVIRSDKGQSQLYFDVIDPESGAVVSTNQTLSPTTDLPSDRLYAGSIDTSSLDSNKTYFVRVKDSTASDPAWSVLYSFTVTQPLQLNFTKLTALNGENTVLDNFEYDQAGNITALRVRIFSNASDADAATAGATDPEPGEVAQYQVTQEHDVPRNVRTFHKCILQWQSSSYPE